MVSHYLVLNYGAKLRFLDIEHTKILFAVLNWGLGHATRSIPIIRRLKEDNNDIVIASSGDSLALLKENFVENIFVELPDYNIRYGSVNMVVNGILQYRMVSKAIRSEFVFTAEIIKKYNIELIISDNRYGVFSNNIRSILITHQINLMMPRGYGFIKPFTQKKNKKYFSNFNEIWVPDFEGDENLSGALSHGISLSVPISFIGPQSRFVKSKPLKKIYNLTFILSGPEPERTHFEHLIRKELVNFQGRAALVLGKIGAIKNFETHYDVYNHLNSKEMQELILQSEYIVCRSGYSSIMDLSVLNAKAVLIPTPGQPEQEYLGKYMNQKKGFVTWSQNDFSLSKILELTEFI